MHVYGPPRLDANPSRIGTMANGLAPFEHAVQSAPTVLTMSITVAAGAGILCPIRFRARRARSAPVPARGVLTSP
jgi:hypothetical protein